MAEPASRVVVVGAGITGLAAAHRLRSVDPSIEVTVLEARDRVGGGIVEAEVGGIRVPAGPEAIYARRPAAVELCRALGIAIGRPAATGTWLWTARGLVEYPSRAPFGIPSELGDVFRWPGITRRGRRRALADLVVRKRRSTEDTSIGALLRRRLGDEVTDRALAPILTDPFGGSVDRLSVRATFPELEAWESSQGSLLRGSMAAMRDARRGELGPLRVRSEGGLEALVAAAASAIPGGVTTSTRAAALEPGDPAWRVRTDRGEEVPADAVIAAVDAAAARRLLGPSAGEAGAELAQIPTVSRGVVLLTYPEGTADGLPLGSGFVAPSGATPITACSWFSTAWPSEAAGTRAVLRCAVGGEGQEELLEADDVELIDACARHLAAVLPLPERPAAAAVVRRPNAAPQYLVGHVERVARIRGTLPAGIFVAGKAFDGVDVTSCVASGEAAADEAAAFVRSIDREAHR